MEKPCEWVYSDPERVLNVYSSNAHDPDLYFIWLERATRTVRRGLGESGEELWARVLQEIEDMRRSLARVGRGELCPIAQVFVGSSGLTQGQERALVFHFLAHAFWREASQTAHGSNAARVTALRELRKLLELFPEVPWADEVRRQITKGDGPRAPTLSASPPPEPWAGKGRMH